MTSDLLLFRRRLPRGELIISAKCFNIVKLAIKTNWIRPVGIDILAADILLRGERTHYIRIYR